MGPTTNETILLIATTLHSGEQMQVGLIRYMGSSLGRKACIQIIFNISADNRAYVTLENRPPQALPFSNYLCTRNDVKFRRNDRNKII